MNEEEQEKLDELFDDIEENLEEIVKRIEDIEDTHVKLHAHEALVRTIRSESDDCYTLVMGAQRAGIMPKTAGMIQMTNKEKEDLGYIG